jgi:FkbM family methyltransferase
MGSLNDFLGLVQSRGLEIKTVYDIGAMHGHWTAMCKQFIPDAKFLLFEANPELVGSLTRSGYPFYNFVLSNPGRGAVDYYAGGLDSGNSYYKESTSYYDQNRIYNLPCVTLDHLIDVYDLPLPNFIKLDTQGSELDVLAGAERAVAHADLIFTECPIVEYNKGAPNIHDYLEYFKSKNFVPVDICDHHIIEGVLIQIDLMFMRTDTKCRVMHDHTNMLRL